MALFVFAVVVCFSAAFWRSASAAPQPCSCSSKRCAGYYVHGYMFQEGSDVICRIETNATGDEDLRHDRFLGQRLQQTWTSSPGNDMITSRIQPSTTDYPVRCLYSVTLANGTSIVCVNLSLPSEVDCGVPQAPASGSIAPYCSTLEGAVISFQCDQGFSPSEEVTATCVRDENSSGTWTPDPAQYSCTNDIVDCGVPQAPASGSITNQSSTLEGAVISFQCHQGFSPSEVVTATCVRDEDTGNRTWTPDPAELDCTGSETSLHPGVIVVIIFLVIAVIVLGATVCILCTCIWNYRKLLQAMEWFSRFGYWHNRRLCIQEEDQDRNREFDLPPQQSRELADLRQSHADLRQSHADLRQRHADLRQRHAMAEEEKGDLKKKLAEAISEIQELKKPLSERASGALVESSPSPATPEDQLSGQMNKPTTNEPCPYPVPSVQENTAAGEPCFLAPDTSASNSDLSSKLIVPKPRVPNRTEKNRASYRAEVPTVGASQPGEIQGTLLQPIIGHGEASLSSDSETDPGAPHDPMTSEERYDERKTKSVTGKGV